MSVYLPRTVASCIGAAFVLAGCSTGSREPAGAAAAAATSLAAWVARSVPAGGVVTVADARLRATLRDAGVEVGVTGSDDTTGYRVTEVGSPDLGVRTIDASVTAVPVAAFPGGGTGSSTLLVDLLVAGPVARVDRAVTAADGQRVTAGRALLGNPAVSVDEPGRTAVAAGGLDLRAAALVAVLSTTAPVTVRAVRSDPAEARVGGPARVLVLAGVAPGAIRAVAAATAGDYRPAITAVTATTTTLTWALAPVTSLTPVPTSTGVSS